MRPVALALIIPPVMFGCSQGGDQRAVADSGRTVIVRGDPASHTLDSVRTLGLQTESLRAEPETVNIRVGEGWPVTQLRVHVLDARGRELPSVPLRIVIADSAIATVRRLRLEGVSPGRTTLDVRSIFPRRDRPAPFTRVQVRVSP